MSPAYLLSHIRVACFVPAAFLLVLFALSDVSRPVSAAEACPCWSPDWVTKECGGETVIGTGLSSEQEAGGQSFAACVPDDHSLASAAWNRRLFRSSGLLYCTVTVDENSPDKHIDLTPDQFEACVLALVGLSP